MDLFEYQAIAVGRWVVLDGAGCAVCTGITWPGVAGRGWKTAAVGSQLGSQMGYRLPREPAGVQPP